MKRTVESSAKHPAPKSATAKSATAKGATAKRALKTSTSAMVSAEMLADSVGGSSKNEDVLGAHTHTHAGHAHATHVHSHDPERKAAHVDADGRERNLKRLRRIEGQVRGLHKMVEDDRYCADIMTQIASVHEALRSVGRELMRNHLKHCATGAIQAGEPAASAMYDELVDMMYKHSR